MAEGPYTMNLSSESQNKQKITTKAQCILCITCVLAQQLTWWKATWSDAATNLTSLRKYRNFWGLFPLRAPNSWCWKTHFLESTLIEFNELSYYYSCEVHGSIISYWKIPLQSTLSFSSNYCVCLWSWIFQNWQHPYCVTLTLIFKCKIHVCAIPWCARAESGHMDVVFHD